MGKSKKNRSVDIRSPGALPDTMTVERMKPGLCYHRNPLMTDVLKDYRYTEKAGRGILRCRRRLKEMKRKSLDIIDTCPELWVILHDD